MLSDRLARMLSDCIAFDTETHMRQPGLSAPPLVCASVARWDVSQNKPIGHILDKEQARQVFLAALTDDRFTLAMANGAFDMLVMAMDAARRGVDILPAIFAAYEAGRVFDIQIAEALHHIALGCLGVDPRTKRKLADPATGKAGAYSLAIVHDLVTGKANAKANDRWRKSYALLEHIPIDQWPQDAREYPIDDACNTLEDALAQTGHVSNLGVHEWKRGANGGQVCINCESPLLAGVSPHCRSKYVRKNIHDLALQAYTHWAMALGAAWGLTPDPAAVARLKYEATKDLAEEVKPFIAAGIIRDDGTEAQNVLKSMVARAYGSKDPCPACVNTTETKGSGRGKARTTWSEPAPGRIPSPATQGRTLVNCPDCDGTGLHLTVSVPRAEKGGVSKGRDQLNESGNELLMSYAAFGEDRKIRTVYVPFMEEGIAAELHLREDEITMVDANGALTTEGLDRCLARIAAAGSRGVIPITLKPNVLLETNRTSYRDKTQTMPREGGVRECFKSRDGSVYYSNDYGGIELCTWAQTCVWMFGHSELAKALNARLNVHAALAATMIGVRYEAFMERLNAGDKEAKLYRQAAKPGNFMFPGGGGVVTFVQTQREQGPDTEHPTGPIIRKGKRVYRGMRFCLLIGGKDRCGFHNDGRSALLTEYRKKPISPTCANCIECAERIKEGWSKQWPESVEYFKIINRVSEQGFQIHPISKRYRGGIGYCDGANGYFQELAAQGAKDALRHVVREQWDASYRPEDLGGERSILYNTSRTIAFLHDELLGEALVHMAPECAERVGTVMVDRMKIYVPDVLVTAEPTLMDRWYKAAACVRDPGVPRFHGDIEGRLKVWQPKAA